MNKVYKGRQKLNFEQAGQYYSHAYKIGVEHGAFTERERILMILKAELPLAMQEQFEQLIKGK